MNNKLMDLLRQVVGQIPQVKQFLTNDARFLANAPTAYKTESYMLAQIEGLVRSVYGGWLGGDFIDILANVISGQLYDAYQSAWIDEGGTGELPDYLAAAYQNAVVGQYEFVDKYYRDIVDARVDKTPLDPLLARARLWARQWTTAYQNAVSLITEEGGGNMEWIEGDTVEKCEQCLAFDGLVARASEWSALGIAPRNAPNEKINCQGWNCLCQLVPTNKRRSSNVYGRLEEILMTRKTT